MKIKVIGKILKDTDGSYFFEKGFNSRHRIEAVHYDPTVLQKLNFDAIHFGYLRHSLFTYQNTLVAVEGRLNDSSEDEHLKIQHAVIRHDKTYNRMRREVEAFANIPRADSSRRERIPDSARLFVWQRDEGKCVKCGSNEKLEFDHIIPVTKGGSNTERNIQLLCETCNRTKGSEI